MDEILDSVVLMIKDRTLEEKIRKPILSKMENFSINEKIFTYYNYHILYKGTVTYLLIIEEHITDTQIFGFKEYLERKNKSFIVILCNEKSYGIIKKVDETFLSNIFTKAEVLSIPTQSSLIPKMSVIDKQELEEMKVKGFSLEKFPRLLMTDILRRWYGFNRGEIIKIESKFGNYYRLVF